MNKLIWLWDALVTERRLTQFPDAVNAAYQCGRIEGRQEGYCEAMEKVTTDLLAAAGSHSKEA